MGREDVGLSDGTKALMSDLMGLDHTWFAGPRGFRVRGGRGLEAPSTSKTAALEGAGVVVWALISSTYGPFVVSLGVKEL